MKVYKIRHKETGKFSSGSGTYCTWTNKGRTWSNISHVRSHLKYHTPSKRRGGSFYENSEIVEAEVDFDNAFTYDTFIEFEIMGNKAKEVEKKCKEAHDKWLRERELEQLAELKRKYELTDNLNAVLSTHSGVHIEDLNCGLRQNND